MNKEVKERLKSIISMLVFLVVATWYWYGPREDLTYLATNMNKYYIRSDVKIIMDENIKLDNNEYLFKVLNKTNEVRNFEIVINNDYFKSRKYNCNLIQNNYLKYQLNTKNVNIEQKNLNVDGIIYRGVIQPNDTIDFSIKLSIDKKDKKKDECFYPVLNASTYYKI